MWRLRAAAPTIQSSRAGPDHPGRSLGPWSSVGEVALSGARCSMPAYLKCRFANARPEPDFRYLSKATALDPLLNSSATTSSHGLNAQVCCDPPELWVLSL